MGLERSAIVFPVYVVVGAAGGGVPLGGVLVLSWCGEVALGGKQ